MNEWKVGRELSLRRLVLVLALAGLGVGLIVGFFLYAGPHNRPPAIVSVSPSPGGASVGTPVTLWVVASDPDGDPLTYSWHCEEDPVINGHTENHLQWIPPAVGVYHITVTISDGVNAPVTYRFDVTVGTAGVPPTASIDAPSEVRVGVGVRFSGAGSTDPDGAIVEYRWDFGDGSTGSGRETTHAYSEPGTYSVTLTVEDNTGLEDSAVFSIAVLEHPSPPYDVEGLYIPSGWMGDYGDIDLDTAWTTNPLSPPVCVKIVYTPSGPLGWAGIYWQYPEQNWGDQPGLDLTGATKLTFWARGESGGEKAEFKVGGIRDPAKTYSDSIYPAASTGVLILSSTWQKYTISLSGRDLTSVIGGFCWVTNSTQNPGGCTIYVDNIIFEA